MKKALSVLAVIFFLLAGGIYAFTGGKDAPQQKQAMAIMQPAATETPTRISTATLTPTPSYVSMAQNTAAALIITQEYQQVELGDLSRIMTVDASTSTAAAVQTQSSAQQTADAQQANARAISLNVTQAVKVTQTAEVIAMRTQSAAATQTMEAPIIRRNEVIADFMPAIILFGFTLATFFVLFLAFNIGWRTVAYVQKESFFARADEYSNEPEPFTATIPNEVITVQETQTNGGYIQAEQFDGPSFLTPEKLAQIADALIESRSSFSRPVFVPTLLTRDQFDIFRRWCRGHEYAAPVNKSVANSPWFVTSKGRRFFESKQGSPPPAQEIDGFTPISR